MVFSAAHHSCPSRWIYPYCSSPCFPLFARSVHRCVSVPRGNQCAIGGDPDGEKGGAERTTVLVTRTHGALRCWAAGRVRSMRGVSPKTRCDWIPPAKVNRKYAMKIPSHEAPFSRKSSLKTGSVNCARNRLRCGCIVISETPCIYSCFPMLQYLTCVALGYSTASYLADFDVFRVR